MERRGQIDWRGDAKGGCPFCGEPATKIVELQISERPAAGEGKPRGKRVVGVSRRLCDRHAYMLLTLLRDGPRRREDNLQGRAK